MDSVAADDWDLARPPRPGETCRSSSLSSFSSSERASLASPSRSVPQGEDRGFLPIELKNELRLSLLADLAETVEPERARLPSDRSDETVGSSGDPGRGDEE